MTTSRIHAGFAGLISKLGLASRSRAKVLITEGKVRVNVSDFPDAASTLFRPPGLGSTGQLPQE